MTQTLQYFEYNIMLDATALAASSVTFLSQGFIIKEKKGSDAGSKDGSHTR